MAVCRVVSLVVEINITIIQVLGIVFIANTKDVLELVGIVKLFQNLGCRFRCIFHKTRKIILLLRGKAWLLRKMTGEEGLGETGVVREKGVTRS
jgi:hypothetical protein